MVVYLDDIIIYSNDEEQHKEDVRKVLETLKVSGLKLNKSKFVFSKKEIEVLGHVVGGGAIRPSPSKMLAIKSFRVPNTKKRVTVFLGVGMLLWNIY